MISEITNISSHMATDMSINEVKYSILSIILICWVNSFISDDEFIIADPLSVSGGINIF